MLMHYRNTAFPYHNELSNYLKIEGPTSEDVFDYLFNIRAEKFLLEKGKKFLYELFEKWNPKHLQLDEYFNDYSDNNGLEDIIGDEDMQNLYIDDYSCRY